MSFEYKKLQERYQTDAAFNRAVNLFRQLIEQYGFQPNELRQCAFLAEYMIQMGSVERIVRTQEEWREIADLRMKMQEMLVADFPALTQAMTSAAIHTQNSAPAPEKNEGER